MEIIKQSILRKEVIQMNESKIVSVQDVIASDNRRFENVQKPLVEILKKFIPQNNENTIIESSVGCLK